MSKRSRVLFKDAFHGGTHFVLLEAKDKKSLERWKCEKAEFDEEALKSLVVRLTARKNKAWIPREKGASMVLPQQFLAFQVYIEEEDTFAVELTLGEQRRLHFSTSFTRMQVQTLHAQVPLNVLVRGEWCTLILDVGSFVEGLFDGAEHKGVKRLEVTGVCKLHRVFALRHAVLDMTGVPEELGVELDYEWDSLPSGVQFRDTVEHTTQVVNYALVAAKCATMHGKREGRSEGKGKGKSKEQAGRVEEKPSPRKRAVSFSDDTHDSPVRGGSGGRGIRHQPPVPPGSARSHGGVESERVSMDVRAESSRGRLLSSRGSSTFSLPMDGLVGAGDEDEFVPLSARARLQSSQSSRSSENGSPLSSAALRPRPSPPPGRGRVSTSPVSGGGRSETMSASRRSRSASDMGNLYSSGRLSQAKSRVESVGMSGAVDKGKFELHLEEMRRGEGKQEEEEEEEEEESGQDADSLQLSVDSDLESLRDSVRRFQGGHDNAGLDEVLVGSATVGESDEESDEEEVEEEDESDEERDVEPEAGGEEPELTGRVRGEVDAGVEEGDSVLMMSDSVELPGGDGAGEDMWSSMARESIQLTPRTRGLRRQSPPLLTTSVRDSSVGRQLVGAGVGAAVSGGGRSKAAAAGLSVVARSGEGGVVQSLKSSPSTAHDDIGADAEEESGDEGRGVGGGRGDDVLELYYDATLNCYMDPVTGKFYRLK